MNEAIELIKTLENLDIQLFDVIQKLGELQNINLLHCLNSYIKNSQNAYSNFVIDKAKGSLISDLGEIKTAIINSNLIEKIIRYQLLISGTMEIIKMDINNESEEE